VKTCTAPVVKSTYNRNRIVSPALTPETLVFQTPVSEGDKDPRENTARSRIKCKATGPNCDVVRCRRGH
jgi:hypothetical protein